MSAIISSADLSDANAPKDLEKLSFVFFLFSKDFERRSISSTFSLQGYLRKALHKNQQYVCP